MWISHEHMGGLPSSWGGVGVAVEWVQAIFSSPCHPDGWTLRLICSTRDNFVF